MHRTRIKFCGITRASDAAHAVNLGVDALGLVLVPASPRFIRPEAAAIIRRQLPPFVACVALFKDADSAFVLEAIDALQPDVLQFHGAEDAAFCASFGLPYMKAVAMGGQLDLAKQARRFKSASALLLDSHSTSGMGGTGKTFDWKKVGKVGKPLVLAGGLKAENVAAGIRSLRPYAVDVSSGIESKPGFKDLKKMCAFAAAVRRADDGMK